MREVNLIKLKQEVEKEIVETCQHIVFSQTVAETRILIARVIGLHNRMIHIIETNNIPHEEKEESHSEVDQNQKTED